VIAGFSGITVSFVDFIGTRSLTTVVARHGGYVGERAREYYSQANDTVDNSVELLHMAFKYGLAVSERHDIREPESYVRTLRKVDRPEARAWRGHGSRGGSRAISQREAEHVRCPIRRLLQAAW
jgi:hypothetical protein